MKDGVVVFASRGVFAMRWGSAEDYRCLGRFSPPQWLDECMHGRRTEHVGLVQVVIMRLRQHLVSLASSCPSVGLVPVVADATHAHGKTH